MPVVSVLMSTYNNAAYLKRAIDSVLSQSFGDFEFVIINDNSSDNTEEILRSYSDARIIYEKNDTNKGLINNLNHGLSIAKGEYIARIDSDDWWLDQNKLDKQVDFLIRNGNYGLVGSWAKVFDMHGNELYNIAYPVNFDKIKDTLLFRNCFVHSSVLFRKKFADSCGNYYTQEKYVEDYGLWLRMGEKFKLANIPEYCVGYLHNETGETQRNNLMQIKGVLSLIGKHRSSYPHYLFAKIRWITKYVIVFCGGLRIINYFKSN